MTGAGGGGDTEPDRIIALARGDGVGLVPRGGAHDAVGQLAFAADATPKSMRWRASAKIGERVHSYEMHGEAPHH